MSGLLVFLQFLFIVLIAFPSGAPTVNGIHLVIFCLGLGVFAAAFLAMRIRTFSVMPEPRAGGELVSRGIYRLVRHPMYLAVLLCALAACLAYAAPWKWLLAGLLTLVLALKIRREERYLLQRYPGYASYRASTKAIIPFLI